MFKENMVAPCGLDCNICAQALIENDPCQGCNGPDDHKPDFCAMYCEIILCRKRIDNGYKYCDECPDYPVSMSWKRRTDTPRSIRIVNPPWRTCR